MELQFLKRIRYGQSYSEILNEIDTLVDEENAFAWRITEHFNGISCTIQIFKTVNEKDRIETWMIVVAFDGTLHTVEIGD